MYDPVNHPGHYTSGGVECIDAIEASMTLEAFKGYLKGNCIKYLYRYEKKQNRSEDLKKCRWYLEKLISIVEERENAGGTWRNLFQSLRNVKLK